MVNESMIPRSMITQAPTFMMRSGRKVPTPAIPMPDLAVPYAAPIANSPYKI